MTPEIAARIQQIRLGLLSGDLTTEQEYALVAEGVALFREARGIVMEAAQEKVKKPKATKAKPKAVSGDDLLNQVLGATK